MSKHWVQTSTGRAFDLLEPRAEDVNLADIAFSLAHIHRYNGHVGPYSVAIHSVACCDVAAVLGLPERVQAVALLHDAAEAYVGDIVSPLKRLLVDTLGPIEERIDAAIAEHFELPLLSEDEARWVARIDHFMLCTEVDAFFPDRPKPWGLMPPDITFKGRLETFPAALRKTIARYNAMVADAAADIRLFLGRANKLGLAVHIDPYSEVPDA